MLFMVGAVVIGFCWCSAGVLWAQGFLYLPCLPAFLGFIATCGLAWDAYGRGELDATEYLESVLDFEQSGLVKRL